MEMIQILRMFIKAERIGDWKLHLLAVQEMLPYFAAAGHNLYAKSAYLFTEDAAIARKSSGYLCQFPRWLSCRTSILDRADLVIEQALMRSIKTVGGLSWDD